MHKAVATGAGGDDLFGGAIGFADDDCAAAQASEPIRLAEFEAALLRFGAGVVHVGSFDEGWQCRVLLGHRRFAVRGAGGWSAAGVVSGSARSWGPAS